MENEPEKLAEKLECMVSGGEETDPEILYRDDFCAADGDAYVARAATLIREQAEAIKWLGRYINCTDSELHYDMGTTREECLRRARALTSLV